MMQKKLLTNQQKVKEAVMHHNKRGYILFLLFSILSVCTMLITLYFSQSVSYQNLMQVLTTQDKAKQLALSSASIGQALLYIPKENKQSTAKAKDAHQSPKGSDHKLLEQVLPYMHETHSYSLSQNVEGMDATLKVHLISENGKLNINSIYDFSEKKFLHEGQEGDRKKFCQWLFEKISKITEKPSLFNAFEKELQNRTHDFNDVTDLLYIKEFLHTFQDHVFYNTNKADSNTIFLADIFTISEQETINPWFLSHSWRILLDLPDTVSLSDEDQKKVLESFKKQMNWDKEWDNSLKLLYLKDYKDLPPEIKSMLTTDFEANIFSLLLQAIIGETSSTIFTILKANTKNELATFDIVKVYQL